MSRATSGLSNRYQGLRKARPPGPVRHNPDWIGFGQIQIRIDWIKLNLIHVTWVWFILKPDQRFFFESPLNPRSPPTYLELDFCTHPCQEFRYFEAALVLFLHLSIAMMI
jgi:hypothetical protein